VETIYEKLVDDSSIGAGSRSRGTAAPGNFFAPPHPWTIFAPLALGSNY